MSIIHGQRGSTLLVALIMLMLLTLIAISAMRSTTASIQVVGNAQVREEATAAGQRAIEKVISDGNFRDTPPAVQNIDINLDGVPDYTVAFNPVPRCTSSRLALQSEAGLPTECYGSTEVPVACYWTVWDISANVTNAATGATVTLHQGVRTVVGLNGALKYCGV